MSGHSKALPPEGYSGGSFLDEISIQKDIQLDNKGGKWKCSGTSDYVYEFNSWDILKTGQKKAFWHPMYYSYNLFVTQGSFFHLYVSQQMEHRLISYM